MKQKIIYITLILLTNFPLPANPNYDDPDRLYNDTKSTNSTKKLEHQIYTFISLSNPYGKIKKVMGNGFGVNLAYYIKLPFFLENQFELKGGALTGLQFQKTKVPNVNAAVTLAPFLFGFRLGYSFFFEEEKYYITPYFTTLGGLIIANTTGSNALQEVIDNTTYDLSFKWELGFEVRNKNPRNISFFAQVGFILELQKINGMYLTYSVGTIFKF